MDDEYLAWAEEYPELYLMIMFMEGSDHGSSHKEEAVETHL